MQWYSVAARGSAMDLCVRVTGAAAPTHGRWRSPAGLDVTEVLGRGGPPAVDVDVWWVQQDGHRGTRLTDLLWDTGMLGLKLVSERMLAVLVGQGADLRCLGAADVRMRDGSPVPGYVAVLEEAERPGPVHSHWRGRRSHELVVSDIVRKALDDAGLTGLDVEEVDGPFPGDRSA